MNAFHLAVEKYRECTRHLRNTYFAATDGSNAAWDIVDQWRELDRLLFGFLVLQPFELKPAGRDTPHPHIFLTFRGAGATLFINREKHALSGYWDHPTKMIFPGDAEMQFRQFFDFDEMAFIDLQYIMVRLLNAKDADLNDRMALVEWNSVEFVKR